MAFPAQALLRRICDSSDKPWAAAYLPAILREDADAWASMLCGAQEGRGSVTGTAAPAADPSPLGDDGSVSGVAGRVLTLSRDAKGCHEVQRALRDASDDEEREALARELRGHVRRLSCCPHGNHVVQACISVLPSRLLEFIIEEVMADGRLCAVARDRFGCRIVQALVHHCPSGQVHDLVELLLAKFAEISRRPYGRFVLQALLQHAAGEQRLRLVELVERHVSDLAFEQNGAALLGAALEHGDLLDRRRLAETILESGGQVAFMAETKHGSAAIASLLEVLDGPSRQRLLSLSETNPKLKGALRLAFEGAVGDWCL